jgi:DNA-binding NarL/FixJ family response regulator/anti-sigma regulatory factor (Ser/Thr protein kinase)
MPAMKDSDGRVSLLIVDDQPQKILALEAVLADLGEEIVTARSGEQALRALLNREFALILLDVNMPGMDGFETARLIRERKSSEHTPIIFITAYPDEMLLARGYSLGAVDYILAPVVPDVLRTKVRVFIELYRKTTETRRQAERLRARARQMGVLASQLIEAEQRERRRLARVLHDHVQQLLAAAMMRVQLAQQNGGGGPNRTLLEVEDLLNAAIGAARSLSLDLHPPVLNDGGMVAALEWLARHTNRNHGLNVTVEGSSEAELSASCRALVFETARELLFNVVKHAGVDRATIRLADSGDRVQVIIEDEGTGFDPDRLESVDEPMNHTGLLRIRERLQPLGGDLEIDSAPGNGTRVTVRVATLSSSEPEAGAEETEKRQQPVETGAAHVSNRIRVMLVDDHAILREGLASLLQRYGDIEVIGEAEDGQVAVELAQVLHPDVVVMDLSMPRLNGIEATKKIVSTLPGVKVVGLSMHDEEYGLSAMRRAGAVECVIKAGPPDDLVTAIRRATA